MLLLILQLYLHGDCRCVKMEIDPKFTFVPLKKKIYVGIDDKNTQEYLCKWGLTGNFVIQNFSFNEPFQQYYKYQLADAFFKDDIVAKALLSKQGYAWIRQGIQASSVQIKQVPCSVLSMSFFNKLRDSNNGIVYNSGTICKRYDLQVEDFLVSDNLRGMLLDEESKEYGLYSEDEKNEFVFRIFQMLVLGGTLCQFEDILQPYLDVTKSIYKDLIRVQKQNTSNDLSVNTLVLEVIAKDSRGQDYFPSNSENRQNIAFLLIDANCHEITTFIHQYGGYCPAD
ncbi:cilia- and flagella-associated protein 300 [Monomorium pharaonis]|uniref:cilia- and flagella-associated protein 300 n=1 Tax=Monomorium pharaonis TaxID=307658 RepID=UPI00174625B6|nr:cilia- and flagella-associated protein 300 [Monomorium pharaonis]